MTAVGFSLVFPFLPLYVKDLGSVTGLSVEMMAGLVIAVQGFTMMLASPLWGAVADRYGRKLMAVLFFVVSVTAYALLPQVERKPKLKAVAAGDSGVKPTLARDASDVPAPICVMLTRYGTCSVRSRRGRDF